MKPAKKFKKSYIIAIIVFIAALVSLLFILNIDIKQSVKSIIIEKEMTIHAGDSKTITPQFDPSDVENITLKWTSSDTDIVEVEDGRISAKAAGTATVIVESGGVKAYCIITVTIPADKIILSESSIKLPEGEALKLKAEVYPEDTTDKTIVWESSDPSIAEVDDGYITTIKYGKATITAKSGEVSAQCELVVFPVIYTIADQQVYNNAETLTFPGSDINDISFLNKFYELKYLNLDNNEIDDISPLAGLSGLERLMLSNNDITDISAVENLKNLASLQLNYNNISDISRISGLVSLESLGLAGNKIVDISALKNLRNLTALSLSDNQISDISVIGRLFRLKELYLDNCGLKDITDLYGLAELESLYIRGNDIPKAQISELKRLLPECKVYEDIIYTNTNSNTGQTSQPVATPQIYISLSEYSLGIASGSTKSITATASNGETVTWETSDATVAGISSEGNTVYIKGINKGTAYVTARVGSASVACEVIVSWV